MFLLRFYAFVRPSGVHPSGVCLSAFNVSTNEINKTEKTFCPYSCDKVFLPNRPESGDLAGKWRVWRVGLDESFLLIFESLKLAGKWRIGGKINFWQENGVLAGKWRAWRVGLIESFLLIFELPKSAGKWRFGGKMNFWQENGVLAGKWRIWRENGGLGGLPLMRAFF